MVFAGHAGPSSGPSRHSSGPGPRTRTYPTLRQDARPTGVGCALGCVWGHCFVVTQPLPTLPGPSKEPDQDAAWECGPERCRGTSAPPHWTRRADHGSPADCQPHVLLELLGKTSTDRPSARSPPTAWAGTGARRARTGPTQPLPPGPSLPPRFLNWPPSGQ